MAKNIYCQAIDKTMRNFVIIAELRSGYQLLSTLLNSNPEILCFGEIFGRKREIRIKSLFNNQIPVLEDKDSAVAYVHNILTKQAENTHRKTFGFKLNYVDCLENENWLPLWDEIESNKWNVIHLRRLNILDRAISEKLAIKQWRWNYQQYDTQIRISFDELDFYYHRAKEWQEITNSRFQKCPIYDLTYEELTQQKNKTCEKLQNFLGVSPINLWSKMPKQRIGGQSTFLLNYRHLYSQCIKHPIYKHYLTDIPVI
jgi:LPS sulfotransferase NodH